MRTYRRISFDSVILFLSALVNCIAIYQEFGVCHESIMLFNSVIQSGIILYLFFSFNQVVHGPEEEPQA